MSTTANLPRPIARKSAPLLEAGDRLSREEFERRYDRMPHLKKAELIEGIVYMGSPVRIKNHARPHAVLAHWLMLFEEETPGVFAFDNGSVRLDGDNEPQPDLALCIESGFGGQASISDDDYLEGAPELAIEIAGSSTAYDLHQKKGAYRRNGVREYLVWITGEERIVWWELHDGEYREISAEADGVLKSRVFPGLWLDAAALLRGDLKKFRSVARAGVKSRAHAKFLRR